MAKEMSNLKKISIVVGIILGVLSILGILFAIDGRFAKSEDITEVEKKVVAVKEEVVKVKEEGEHIDELLEERIAMGAIEDQIKDEMHQLERIEDWRRFEQRTEEPELTPIEKETLDKSEKRLKELRNKKVEREKFYEQLKKNR